MEMIIKLSRQTYQRLRDHVPAHSPAHEPIEKAAPIDHSVEGVTFAGYSIACDDEQALVMLDVAKRHCPDAVTEIEKALASARGHS